jgi:tryptophanyl-tRNA synthetase
MRIFSGIQPTGAKHFGNYSGGFRQYAAMQDLGEAFFCIVDLHSLTTPQDPEGLREGTFDLAAMLIATGLDPSRSTIFVQSHVPAHAECAWIVSCVATYGELNRMTQFKDKGKGQGSASAGLFTYPALMAADILLYHTDKVPVGDDQRQHLELARDIAQRFNSRYGELLTLPAAAIPGTGGRVMDLQDPTRKMSTTRGTPQGTVLLADSTDVVTRKIRSAVTDSGREVRRDGEGKEGIANLIEILAVARGISEDEVEREFDGSGYGDFKTAVAEAVVDLLAPVREHYEELRPDEAALEATLGAGAEKAREIASGTLAEVRLAIGVGPAAS